MDAECNQRYVVHEWKSINSGTPRGNVPKGRVQGNVRALDTSHIRPQASSHSPLSIHTSILEQLLKPQFWMPTPYVSPQIVHPGPRLTIFLTPHNRTSQPQLQTSGRLLMVNTFAVPLQIVSACKSVWSVTTCFGAPERLGMCLHMSPVSVSLAAITLDLRMK